MKRTRNKRGSVLLMVVGLLTILYMLLGTFLIVARYDQAEAQSLATEAQNDPGAAGMIGLIKQRLADDLHTDSNNPYAALDATPQGWKGFIDYPAEDVDAHLASSYDATLPVWKHISNLVGLDAAKVTDVFYYQDITSPDYEYFLDLDGDGREDAYRFETGLVDPKGRVIHGFVRILDTSAFLNLTIGNGPDCLYGPSIQANWTAIASTPYSWGDWKGADFSINPLATTPCDIDVVGLLDSSVVGAFHYSRIGTSTPTTSNLYWYEFAQHPHRPGPYSDMGLPAPSYYYRPFDPGEEIFLRYTGSPADNAGLLPQLINDSNPDNRIARKRKFTTTSVSRQLLRRPKTGSANPDDDRTARMLVTRNFEPDPWLYEQLVAAGAGEKEAAHFLANLWAYTSADEAHNNAFAFSPSGKSWKVYGAAEQLVITDAYVYYKPQSTPGTDDSAWAVAIELMNPCWRSVNIQNYTVEGLDLGTLGPASVAPGDSIILWTVGNGPGATTPLDSSDFNFPAEYEVTELAVLAKDAGTIEITRDVDTESDIPVDKVSAFDLGYTKPATGEAAVSALALRDDSWGPYNPSAGQYGGRQRALVAEYQTSAPGMNYNKAGPNGLAASSLPNVNQGFGLFRMGGVPYNLGELGRIFTIGPDDSGNDLPHQLKSLAGSASRGKLDFHGNAAGGDDSYPSLPWATLLPELVDVLPGDRTRGPIYPTQGHIEHRRVYGRVNINTAPREVLAALPWPDELLYRSAPLTIDANDRAKIAEYIQCYRDGQAVSGGPDYSNRAAATGIGGLRDGVTYNGFLTPGELAIPLGDYVAYRLSPADRKRADYASMFGRYGLYRSVSNLVTVQSDTYVVLLALQVWTSRGLPKTWQYMALIDRSIVGKTGQQPAVLMFTKLE